MAAPGEKKLYGLITKKNAASSVTKVASVFANSDDEEMKVDVSNKNQSASSIRVQKEAERAQQLAMAQDPLIFDYDANYDIIQRKKDEKTAEDKAKDHLRESKYAPTLMKAHKIRVLEEKSREERQQQRERVKEDGEFADKEVFVTGAYRNLMEEVHKHREEEALKNRIDDATSIEKQMIWQTGFSRNLLETIARRDDNEPSQQDKEKQNEKVEFKAKKPKNIRRRGETSDDEENDQKTQKQSIYDSEEEEKSVVHKNFEGELKAGLNKPAARPQERVMTKAERLRRQFTPSDDEEDSRHATTSRGREAKNRGQQSRSLSPEHADQETTKKDKVTKKKHLPADSKEAKALRLKNMKAILQQRNGPTEIEAARQRFIERRSSGIVTAPF
ncbi:unnamed protein product, partial [Mesorhabditis belari]|uniref:Nuclear speckle splicing regulatory protein 1 N-terminal domain-containing protein n=1 Tax=Mesorhabditis belari TaxID=2138241 RepID=A0AAF3E9M7_9BILA